MWQNVALIGLFGLLLMAALWLASKWGSKSAQLAALKEETKRKAKEQEKANANNKRVDDMPLSDVRERLQNTHRD